MVIGWIYHRNLKLEEEEPDARGEWYSWIYRGKYYCILYTRAGMYRGAHKHPVTQYTLLLDGKGKYVFKVGNREEEHPLKPGDLLKVPAGVPHIFLAETDCLSIEWWDGLYSDESCELEFAHYLKKIYKRIIEFNKDLQKRIEEYSKRLQENTENYNKRLQELIQKTETGIKNEQKK